MTTFKYKAQSSSGKAVNGVVEAYDEFDAVARIKADYPIVLSVVETTEKPNIFQRDIGGPPKIKEKYLALVCSQFSIIIGAGLPMVRSVELVAAQTEDKHLRKLLEQVAGDVAAGNSLADSFEHKGKNLPPTFIETIRAGEEAGTLDTAFDNLFHYFDKSAKTRDKVVGAMIYPAFLCVISVIVVIVLMVTAIPMFSRQFEHFDIELPGITKALIATSNFMTAYWMPLLAAVIGLIIGIKMWSKTLQGKKFFAILRMKLPVIKNVEKMNAASQFANTMSTILSAGMPMTRTITITARVVSNYVISLDIGDMVSGVEEGRPLADCLRQGKWLPSLLIEMTGVGEDAGSLENTLHTIGAYYDNEVNIATQRLLSVMEPAIIVILAGVVGTIVMGFYMPMFTMYGAM